MVVRTGKKALDMCLNDTRQIVIHTNACCYQLSWTIPCFADL